MSTNMTIYGKMTNSPEMCLEILTKEIGVKSKCIPFAMKVMDGLKALGKLDATEALNAANVMVSGLQTLYQGGIKPEDYDKVDFVKRGKVSVPSARVEAFYRAAARKGYRIIDTIVAVPKEDANTTYMKEHFHNGEIIYVLMDERVNPDRAITAERVFSGYFAKYICRLEVAEIKTAKRLAMVCTEMTNDELLTISDTSEQGIRKAAWEKYRDNWGKERKRRVVKNEMNTDTFWIKWTGAMVEKTIIRRSLKRIREALPELEEVMYAFQADEEIEKRAIEAEAQQIEATPIIEIKKEDYEIPDRKTDINNPTEAQKQETAELLETLKKNPKMAEQIAKELKARLDGGEAPEIVLEESFAEISNLRKSKKLWPMLEPYFKKTVG